ncbi:TPA: hypothetical protein SMF43_001519 [Serratia marcescens]|nr:hypothetical protein [Serratia marcescens]
MTLTTEQLRARAAAYRRDAETLAELGDTASSQRLNESANAFDELAANREAQPVGYFLRYRVEWHTPSKWSAWAEIDEATYDNAVKIIATGDADAGRFYEARILYDAPPAPANSRAVAWEMRYWNSGYNMWHDWERITAEQHAEMSVQHAADNDYEFRVLYDAPLAPKSNAADWGINMQTGTPILVYKNCSVIESEQAHYVLSLINSAVHPAPAVPVLITEDEQEEDVSQGYANSFRGGWNACRAAMLAAAPEGGN